MNQKELQKAIVSFLILAIMVSSGVFFYAASLDKKIAQKIGGEDETVSNNGANRKPVFIEQVTQTSFSTNATIILKNGGQISATGNLTRDFANIMAYQTMDQNPDAIVDNNGQITPILPENLDSILVQYIAQKPIVPAEVAKRADKNRIKISSDSSAETLAKYLEETNRFVANAEENRSIQNLANAPMTDELLFAIQTLTNETKERVYALAAPEVASGFHVALLEVLETQDSFVQLLTDDPLRAQVLLDTVTQIQKEQLESLDRETEKIVKIIYDSPEKYAGEKNIIHAIFGIPTANAQFVPVVDAPHTKVSAANFWQKLLEWVIKGATEWLKNRLIREFVNMVVAWINGTDYNFGQTFRPRFVTNWKTYLKGAASEAAGAVIEELAPGFCDRWGPLVKILRPNDFSSGFFPSSGGCTLTRVIRNLAAFERNFENGGWAAYSSYLDPDNSFFFGIMSASDKAQRAAAAAKEAAKSEAEAGASYTGTKKKFCEEGVLNESGTQCVTVDVVGGIAVPRVVGTPTEETTTPGKNLADTFSRAINAPIDRIVNAQTVEAIVGLILDAMATKLFASGDDGVTQGNVTRAAPITGEAACSGYERGSPEFTDCVTNLTNPPFETEGTGPTDETQGGECSAPVPIASTGGTPEVPAIAIGLGSVFTPTEQEPRKVFFVPDPTDSSQNPRPIPDGITYKYAQVKIDVTIGSWYSDQEKKPFHNILWLHRGSATDIPLTPFRWEDNVIGLVSVLGPDQGQFGSNALHLGSNLNSGTGEQCILNNSASYEFQEGETYRFVFLYDTAAKTVNVSAYLGLDDAPVVSVTQPAYANVIQSDNPTDDTGGSGFFLVLGNDPSKSVAGAPTYGWTYRLLEIDFTQEKPQ